MSARARTRCEGAIAIASTFLLACGSASVVTAPASPSPPSDAPLTWSIGAFSVTLPDGVRLAMDTDGSILRDGALALRMQADGRVVDASGDTVAALLADGQISHRRELQPGRLSELPSVLDGARQLVLRARDEDLLVLEGDTLRIAEHGGWPHGHSELDAGSSSGSRALVVFVTLIELLEHPRSAYASALRPTAPSRGDALPAPIDVVAPPAHATRTASGLAYVVLAPGRGTRRPGPRSRVRVHYTGWTTGGVMFDSSVARGEASTFPLHAVIPGWTEGLQLMVEGQRTRFWMPPALAYGEHPRPGVPAGMLVFDVELLEIVDP